MPGTEYIAQKIRGNSMAIALAVIVLVTVACYIISTWELSEQAHPVPSMFVLGIVSVCLVVLLMR